ncbi:MAG: hypothetical protein QOD98_3475 [Nocardioidaceae bacterium]|nr:hypothetical protein [Nocardioidaceae bacterium]
MHQDQRVVLVQDFVGSNEVSLLDRFVESAHRGRQLIEGHPLMVPDARTWPRTRERFGAARIARWFGRDWTPLGVGR